MQPRRETKCERITHHCINFQIIKKSYLLHNSDNINVCISSNRIVLVAQVGSEAGIFSHCFRPCWEYLLGFIVLSCHKRVFNFEVHWPNFRGKHQVSYMARTHCNDPLHSPWSWLYHFLVQDTPNLRGNT